MMPLAILANVLSMEDQALLDTFSFANQDHHRLVLDHIASKTGRVISDYNLDPITSAQLAVWLQIHQDSHNQINGALGVQGNDLSSVDFRDYSQAAAWARLHLSEHLLWQQKTGVA